MIGMTKSPLLMETTSGPACWTKATPSVPGTAGREEGANAAATGSPRRAARSTGSIPAASHLTIRSLPAADEGVEIF